MHVAQRLDESFVGGEIRRRLCRVCFSVGVFGPRLNHYVRLTGSNDVAGTGLFLVGSKTADMVLVTMSSNHRMKFPATLLFDVLGDSSHQVFAHALLLTCAAELTQH